MKKKIDAMTVISIVLIVINLVVFLFLGVNSSSEPEFVNGASLLNLDRLFGGNVYAAGILIQPTSMSFGIMRNDSWLCTNYKSFMVSNIDNISSNKVF